MFVIIVVGRVCRGGESSCYGFLLLREQNALVLFYIINMISRADPLSNSTNRRFLLAGANACGALNARQEKKK